MADKKKQVLDFWFNDIDSNLDHLNERNQLWWSHDSTVDDEVKRNFHTDVIAARNGGYQSWLKTPEGSLAYIILLDQFSRHIYRGTANAFAGDDIALSTAQEGIIAGFDKELSFFQRAFYYLPFEHAEDPQKQTMSVQLYKNLADSAAPEHKETAALYLKHAEEHKDTIDRFGRFPARNEALDRESSEQELDYILD